MAKYTVNGKNNATVFSYASFKEAIEKALERIVFLNSNPSYTLSHYGEVAEIPSDLKYFILSECSYLIVYQNNC
jgi:hypothetical protein